MNRTYELPVRARDESRRRDFSGVPKVCAPVAPLKLYAGAAIAMAHQLRRPWLRAMGQRNFSGAHIVIPHCAGHGSALVKIMPNPVVLAVHDDDQMGLGLEGDLERAYGARYRVIGERSARTALSTLRTLRHSESQVALLLVDRELDMTTTTFLEEATALYPDARRVLCVPVGEVGHAIDMIKRVGVGIDHCLARPWKPADRFLYPVIDDLLDDWTACPHPSLSPVTVVGYRFSPESHQLRDFLARNGVPFRWLDIERDPEALRVFSKGRTSSAQLPLLRFPDGAILARPTPAEVAARIGLHVRPHKSFYDLVIIGGGPTGLAAAVYGASEGLRVVIVERHAPGGQAGMSAKIENYLGFPAGLSGTDLTHRAVAQAKKFGAEMLAPQAFTGLRAVGSSRVVTLSDGAELCCHTVLLATGVEWRRLEARGIDRLLGRGISYGGTTTEAMFCRNEDIVIVGGGNSAGQAALAFSRYARHVTLLVRESSLTQSMSQYLVDQIGDTRKVTVRLGTTVIEAQGDKRFDSVVVHDAATGSRQRLPATAMFIFIGGEPFTACLAGVLDTDRDGFILTGPDLAVQNGDAARPRAWTLDRGPFLLETSLPGVFAAGDVRHGSAKRVAAGVGEGATAIQFVHQYLRSGSVDA